MGLYPWGHLENGELQQYDFPGAVETELWGISDSTGALTGNFIDASGVRRGFSGDTIVEVPGALETYADFVNSEGGMVGSYIDADGVYNAYVSVAEGDFVSLNLEAFSKTGILFCARYQRCKDYRCAGQTGRCPSNHLCGSIPRGTAGA